MRRKNLTPDERLAVIEEYRAGIKLMSTAAAFGLTESAVSRIAERAGLPRRGEIIIARKPRDMSFGRFKKLLARQRELNIKIRNAASELRFIP
jgi:diketogulonate reductase-like aldo/keto reductase